MVGWHVGTCVAGLRDVAEAMENYGGPITIRAKGKTNHSMMDIKARTL